MFLSVPISTAERQRFCPTWDQVLLPANIRAPAAGSSRVTVVVLRVPLSGPAMEALISALDALTAPLSLPR
jgi:hypothetical protein